MAFLRRSGSDRGTIKRTISSLACAVGDLLVYSRTGAVVEAAQATSEVDNLAGVCVAATTTADTEVLLERLMPGDVYETTPAAAANAAHNYMRMIWAAGHGVTNSGTDVVGDTGLFMQTGLVGSANIIGEFVLTSHGD